MSGARRGISWTQLVSSATELPGVEEGTAYGTPALRVRKRFLARLKEDGDSVAIRIPVADREVLLEGDPSAFYLTDHYRPHPAVLMRLSRVQRAVALAVLEQAWQYLVPKSLARSRLPAATTSTSKGRVGKKSRSR